MKEMTFIVIIKKRCQKIEVIITMNNRIISIIKDLCEIEKNITIEDLAQNIQYPKEQSVMIYQQLMIC